MDRTTLTAALKPLERRGLAATVVDTADRRARKILLTKEGEELLAQAVPLWRAADQEMRRALASVAVDRLARDLKHIS